MQNRMDLYKKLDTVKSRQEILDLEAEIDILMGNTVTLQPIAMVIPTRNGVYAPSRLKQPKTISNIEFLTKYADHPRPIKVSFADDGKSNPQIVTAYGFGLDCWWIIV